MCAHSFSHTTVFFFSVSLFRSTRRKMERHGPPFIPTGFFFAFSLHPLNFLMETWMEHAVLWLPSKKTKNGNLTERTLPVFVLTLKSMENKYKWKCFCLYSFFVSIFNAHKRKQTEAKSIFFFFTNPFAGSVKRCFQFVSVF